MTRHGGLLLQEYSLHGTYCQSRPRVRYRKPGHAISRKSNHFAKRSSLSKVCHKNKGYVSRSSATHTNARQKPAGYLHQRTKGNSNKDRRKSKQSILRFQHRSTRRPDPTRCIHILEAKVGRVEAVFAGDLLDFRVIDVGKDDIDTLSKSVNR